MIQANELRIGNLTMQGVVSEIDKDSFRVLNKNKESLKSTWFEIDPIPLTEDWLIKFGFDSLYISDNGITFRFEKIGSDLICHIEDSIILGIQYVHELQNLYFAITGEELTIKN